MQRTDKNKHYTYTHVALANYSMKRLENIEVVVYKRKTHSVERNMQRQTNITYNTANFTRLSVYVCKFGRKKYLRVGLKYVQTHVSQIDVLAQGTASLPSFRVAAIIDSDL